ncbi:MAG: hypothetical protein AAGG48_16610 [Planctomycetota bacterium]
MNAEAIETPSNGRRRSWRPEMIGKRSIKRQLRRIISLVLGVGLICLLIYLLASPFWHPNSYLVVLSETDYGPDTGIPSAMAANDLDRMTEWSNRFAPLPWQSESNVTALSAPADILDLLQKLESHTFEKSDVLVLYIQARGIVIDGEPLITCKEFDVGSPADGTFAFSELVRRVGDLRPGTKLLVCHFEDREFDPRIGQLSGSFSQATSDAFRNSGRDGIWMLSSHGMLEQAAGSESLQASQFFFWLDRGLQGWADTDESESVDIAELHQYVYDNVLRASALRSNGYTVQTPRLDWGGDAPQPASSPTLVSTSGFQRDASNDSVATIAMARMAGDDTNPGGLAGLIGDARGMIPGGSAGAGTQGAGVNGESSRDETSSDENSGNNSADDGAPENSGKENTTASPGSDGSDDADAPPDAPDADSTESGTNGLAGLVPNSQGQVSSQGQVGSRAPASVGLKEIAKAWSVFEALKQGASPRAIDSAPHLWRQLERTLFWYERKTVEGNLDASSEQDLRRLTFALQELAKRKPVTESMHPLIGGISEQWAAAREYTAQESPASESIVRDYLTDPSLTAASWLQKHPQARESSDFSTRLAVQLADAPQIPADLARRAVTLRAMGERLARDPRVVSGMLRDQLMIADASRRKAERQLFDRTRTDWRSFSQSAMDVAETQYQKIESAVDALRSAYRTKVDILDSVPHYLELRMQFVLDPYAKLMTFQELQELIKQLVLLRNGIGNQDIAAASAAVRELEPYQIRLQRDPARYATSLQQQRRPNLHACEALSRSLALPFDQRRALSESLEQLDVEAWRSFDPNEPTGDLILSDRRRANLELVITQQIALQTQLLRFSSMGLNTPSAFDGLEKLQSDAVARLDDPQSVPFSDLVDQSRQVFVDSYDALPLAIRQTFQSIGNQGPANANATDVIRDCLQSVHLLDPRDLGRLDEELLLANLIDQASRDQLRLAIDRWEFEREDARDVDIAYVEAAIEQTTYELRVADPTSDVLRTQGDLSIEGPSRASLESVSERELFLRLSSSANEALPAWIILEYDDSLLDVETRNDVEPMDRWQWLNEVQSSSRLAVQRALWMQRDSTDPSSAQDPAMSLQRAIIYPERPELAGVEPTLVFERGANRELGLRVKRRVSVSAPTRLIVKLISANEYVRRELEIVFPKPPTLELTAGGPQLLSTPVDNGIILHPLPNRKTEFRLSLVNQTGGATACDLTLLAPVNAFTTAMPTGAVDRDRAQEVVQSLGPVTQVRRVEEVTVPPGDRIPLLPLFYESAENGAEPETEEKAKPKPIASPHGLVLRIDDRLTGETVFRKIGIAPQRPSRFLQPQIDFDVLTRRMEIRVNANSPGIIPPEGIDVSAEIRGRGTAKPVILNGVIDSPSYSAELLGYIPASVDWARVTLTIDNYPRAFVMDVPCSDSITNYERQAELFEVRLLSPSAGRSFSSAVDAIPVELQVDAPSGSFPFLATHEDYVEVGVDRDRDREFRDERPLRLRSDRSIEIFSLPSAKSLAIDVSVTDFKIEVPTRNARDIRANVLARLVSGRRSTWSEPIEVVLDGRGPDIEKIVLLPDRMARIGKKLDARIWVADAELSGVQKVEVVIDKEGKGEFPEEDPPIAAKLDQDRNWIAEVPLEEGQLQPGVYDVLVRATDNVDNTGPIRRVSIRVLEMSDDPDADRICEILGVASYWDVPLADAVVTLRRVESETPAQGTDESESATTPAKPVPGPTRTNSKGQYRLEGVYPGKYILRVKGLLRNKPRIEEKEIDVIPNRRRQIQVDFDIR